MNYRRKLKQYAVYWAPTGSNNAGQEQFATPVEIRCRWEVGVQEMISAVGQAWVSKSKVFHTHLTEEGGFLWRGRLADVTDEDDPTLNQNAGRIFQVDEAPSRRATQFLRVSYL